MITDDVWDHVVVPCLTYRVFHVSGLPWKYTWMEGGKVVTLKENSHPLAMDLNELFRRLGDLRLELPDS